MTKAQIRDGNIVVEKYPAMQTSVQKMVLRIDHQSVMSVLGFVGKLVNVLTSERQGMTRLSRMSFIQSGNQLGVGVSALELCP